MLCLARRTLARSSSLWLLLLMILPTERAASSSELAVVSLTLIDADTDQPIAGFDPLQDNAVLNLALLPTRNLNVRANTSPSTVGSVRFGLNEDPAFRTESVAPYALAGDRDGDYDAWEPPLGANNLTATPYTGAGGGGSPGVSLSLVFTVIDDATGNLPPVADAGPDLVVGLPPGTAVLDGSGQDADGSISSYSWDQLSGPPAELGDTKSPTLTVTGLTEGTHVYQLTVTDNEGASGSDEAQVVVYPTGGGGGTVSGDLKKWHKVEIEFRGPSSTESSDSPNPFLDYRLNATLQSPSGRILAVPGFYAGDGNGGGEGDVWKVRFNPDEAGEWTYVAQFRTGADVAVDTNTLAGTATAFDGSTGSFTVADTDSAAPGFLKWGLLEWVGAHYLKFRDGPYWLKGGADSPENFLGYEGFDNTPNYRHSYPNHTADWEVTDPNFVGNTTGYDAKAIIGAINYLADHQVNSVYFLPMNIGGDGKDTWPFVGPIDWNGSSSNDNLHYDIGKLEQWEIVFEHLQKKGLHLHFVLNEAEEPNKKELDGGTLGKERKLFYRELIARFAHHNALQWNVSEEYDYQYNLTANRVKQFAAYIQDLDPYDHPITVHQFGNPETTWTPFLGDGRFSLTSFQFAGSTAGRGAEVEKWRWLSRDAGRPIPISLDEVRSTSPSNLSAQRKDILWPTYLSGGQVELYMGGEDQSLEDFTRYEEIWDWMWYARRFLQENFPFWDMEPNDDLVSGVSNPQCLALPGSYYAIYLPSGGDPTVDLTDAAAIESFQITWYDPITGDYLPGGSVAGGGLRDLGPPPFSDDVAVALTKTDSPLPVDNQAPVVDAGFDREITLPANTVALSGSATDDGLPDPPSSMTYAWTVVSGPGSVGWSNKDALNTSASFSTAGNYTLRLTAYDGVLSSSDDVTVVVTGPASDPRMWVDVPAARATVAEPIVVAGWALDLAAGSIATGGSPSTVSGDTGVDLVEAFAVPAGGGAPIDLGDATLGLSRPDVGSYFGDTRFDNSGFTLTVDGLLSPGDYTLQVKARSIVDGRFNMMEVPITITVGTALMWVDLPQIGSTLAPPFLVSGWAFDTAATAGVGVDQVKVEAFPAAGGPPVSLGSATLGIPRPDVGAFFGDTRLDSSGFLLSVTMALADGNYTLRVSARNATTGVFEAKRDIAVTVASSAPLRVNAGGGDFTDPDGNLWSTDTDFVNTGKTYSTGAAISGTALDALYQSERWDASSLPEMRYAFSLDPGLYRVRLHFAEIYSGAALPGARLFDVLVEGELMLDDYDIFSQAGFRAAAVEEFSVRVDDGTLDIELLHVVENPKISAIEILPVPE